MKCGLRSTTAGSCHLGQRSLIEREASTAFGPALAAQARRIVDEFVTAVETALGLKTAAA
jgi:hypothetical protein